MSSLSQADYRSLPAQTSQQVIKLLYKNWKSFYKSVGQYKKAPRSFRGRPKPPKYKDKNGKNIVVFTNQQVKIREGLIKFPKRCNLSSIKTKAKNLVQVRIIPQFSCYTVEVVYEKGIERVGLDPTFYLSIDLGLNNFATSVDNSGGKSFIINGKTIKSCNQYFNKKKAKLMSYVGDRGTSKRIRELTHKRNCKVEDFLHKTSRFIIDYCVANKIKTVVVGLNKLWKQDINIGERNNQNFVGVPHSKFISKLIYKAEEVGIEVITHEESYTSKCDSLAFETMGKKESYLGNRKKRGLFQSSERKLLNADVNGSLNILRKVTGDSVAEQIISRGLVFNPVRLNII